MRRYTLERRALLRGAVAGGALVTLPLPRLSVMLNGNGTAYAQGAPLRRTFGVWFFGNGVVPNRWIPQGEGADFPLSEQLAPLAKVKTKLTVVSGMQLKTGRMSAHSYGATGGLGGAPMANGGNVSAPTIDQIIADVIAGDTRRSIEIGVTKARHRTKGQMYDAVSHRGTNQPNYPEFNPAAVFTTLFPGAGKGAAARAAPGADRSAAHGPQERPRRRADGRRRRCSSGWGARIALGSMRTSRPCAAWSGGCSPPATNRGAPPVARRPTWRPGCCRTPRTRRRPR